MRHVQVDTTHTLISGLLPFGTHGHHYKVGEHVIAADEPLHLFVPAVVKEVKPGEDSGLLWLDWDAYKQ